MNAADQEGRCRVAESLLHAAGVDARVTAAGPNAEIASVYATPAAFPAVQGVSARIKALGFRYVALALDAEQRDRGQGGQRVKEHGAAPPRHDKPDAEGP